MVYTRIFHYARINLSLLRIHQPLTIFEIIICETYLHARETWCWLDSNYNYVFLRKEWREKMQMATNYEKPFSFN